MRIRPYAPGRTNGWHDHQCTAEFVRKQLRKALDALEGLEGKKAPQKAASKVRTAYQSLDELARYLPKVECWCVVKYYPPHYWDIWKPAVWDGCLTKKQAEAFAKICQEHYARDTGRGERYVVERRACDIRMIHSRSVTPDEYREALTR